MKIDFEQLAATPLFRGIPSVELETLFGQIVYRSKRFGKEETVLQQNMQYETLFLLLKGDCAGEMTNYSGKTIKVEDFAAPNAIATGILFAKNNRLPVSLRTRTESTFLCISKADLFAMIRLNEQLMKNILEDISDKIFLLSKRLEFMSFNTIKSKLAHYLLKVSNGQNEFTMPLSLEELALYFGVARPSLSRVLQEIEESGAITKHGRTVRILDRPKLIQASE